MPALDYRTLRLQNHKSPDSKAAEGRLVLSFSDWSGSDAECHQHTVKMAIIDRNVAWGAHGLSSASEGSELRGLRIYLIENIEHFEG